MNQSNPERTGRAMTMRKIREALGHNVNPQPPVDRAAWVDGDPLMEAIAHAVWAKCSTEGTSLVVDDPRNIAAVAATAARAAVRAETLRDVEEICDEAGAVYTSKALNGEATGAYELMERFRRKAEEAETATPAVVAAPTDRAAVAERLWQVAEQNIIAEWICCDPINPKHQLCVQGDATLRMVRALLVDDPKAAKPAAPLLDAVLAVLPEPTDRAAVLREAADHLLTLKTPPNYVGVHGLMFSNGVQAAGEELRRLAVEAHDTGTQQPECAASISGNCLAEAQSESVCDTDDGECVHGGRPSRAQQQPDTEAQLASLAVNAAHALRDEKRHYEIACQENARLRATIERVRQLNDRLAEETDLASPDDSITRGAAAKRIAAALDGWNPSGAPQCDVEFEGGGRCAKPAGHRPAGSDDPHVPAPVAQQPAAEAHSCSNCEGVDPGSCLMNPERRKQQAHAEGEHCFCGPECDTTEQQAAAADGEETLCRCGHGRAYHDAKYADPQCRLCPEDGERSWRHPFTPADVPRP